METITNHDAYIVAALEAFRPLLAQLRSQLAGTLRDVKEIISYNMPGFGIGKTVAAGYAAFSKQCGLYVALGAIVAHGDVIAAAGLNATKTALTFSLRNPFPNELVRTLALSSREQLGFCGIGSDLINNDHICGLYALFTASIQPAQSPGPQASSACENALPFPRYRMAFQTLCASDQRHCTPPRTAGP